MLELSFGHHQLRRGREARVAHVIGLFNDRSSAPQVVDALINSGFSRSRILRREGSTEDLVCALVETGIDADEAHTYAADLPGGGAFILVRVAAVDVERAIRVMNRFVQTKKKRRGKRRR